MEVLVVGGVKSFVLGPVQKHLKAEGVNIAWFVSEKDNLARTYTGIPAGCEGVIVMRDGISHSLSGKVNNDAKAAGVRIAMVDRQWSRSEGLLRKHGFLPPKNVTTASNLADRCAGHCRRCTGRIETDDTRLVREKGSLTGGADCHWVGIDCVSRNYAADGSA